MNNTQTVIHADAPATAAQRRLLEKHDARLPRETARAIYEATTGSNYFARTAPNRYKIPRGVASDLIDAYRHA